MLVELAAAGRLGALLAEDAELLFWEPCLVVGSVTVTNMWARRRESHVPLFNTARHSSSVRWSGKDILLESAALVPNRLPRKGMEGMDLRADAR